MLSCSQAGRVRAFKILQNLDITASGKAFNCGTILRMHNCSATVVISATAKPRICYCIVVLSIEAVKYLEFKCYNKFSQIIINNYLQVSNLMADDMSKS